MVPPVEFEDIDHHYQTVLTTADAASSALGAIQSSDDQRTHRAVMVPG